MTSETRALLKLSFLLESTLFIVASIWIYSRSLPFSIEVTWLALGQGLVGCIALLTLNFSFFNRFTLRLKCAKRSYDFIKSFVIPLAHALDTPSAFYIALSAGIGEEFLFRGALEVEAGIILSNIAFSLIHFGRTALSYPLLAILYFAAGLILSMTKTWSGGLFAPIVTHITFDFLSLLYVKHLLK